MLDLTLYRCIAFQARITPKKPALFAGGSEISYSRFRDDIDAITSVLAAQALEPGTRVAMLFKRGYLGWTVAIACLRLKLPTVHVDEIHELAAIPECVLVTDSDAAPEGARVIRLSQEAFKEGAAMERHRDTAPDPDALARIVLSSGTTGTPKKIPVTYEEMRQRCMNVLPTYGVGPDTRFLVGVGTGTVGGFMFSCSVWFAGGSLVLRAPELTQAYRTGRPTLVFVPPSFLEKLVDNAGDAATAPADAPVIFTGGAPLRDALNESARKRLSPSLFVLYGSTEVSTVTIAPGAAVMGVAGCVGFTLPYADVQVVDDDHRPVPQGTEGMVRARGEGMAHEYLDDEQATARAFRDGWFYPGDIGRFDRAGALHVTGRIDELANLGGFKLAPERIDAALKDVPGLADAAAFSVRGDPNDELWLAVVEGEGFDGKAVRSRYMEAFPKHPFPKLMRLEQIPRNAMGKVRRVALREAVLKSKAAKE